MSGSLVRAAQLGLRTKAAVAALTVRDVYGPVREPFAGAWQQGVSLDPIGSLASYSPIYACATRIASDIAKLGINLRVAGADGVADLAPKESPFWRTLRKPNGYQNRIQFIRRWLLSKKLFGNTYVLKAREEARGMVRALYVLDPRRVQAQVTPQGDVYYSISGDDLSRVHGGLVVPASEVIHDLAPTLWHPLVGVPPIYACALSGTLGLTIQRNSAAFFANASRPSGMLSAPGTIDDVTAERLRRDWEKNYSAANIGRLAVLGDGLEYKAMTIAAEQSQLSQQLGLSAIDVATAHGMPAYKINQGPMPTNNNVQALNQQYYTDCLQTDIEDIELCLTEGLEVTDGYSVEFDLDGLLRMDSATQMEFLSKGVGSAIVKPNEARRKLNMPKAAGGDELYLQEQNFSLPALAKRDARDDPFAKGSAAPAPAPAPAADPEDEDATKELRDLLPSIAGVVQEQVSSAQLATEQRVVAMLEAQKVAQQQAHAAVESLITDAVRRIDASAQVKAGASPAAADDEDAAGIDEFVKCFADLAQQDEADA